MFWDVSASSVDRPQRKSVELRPVLNCHGSTFANPLWRLEVSLLVPNTWPSLAACVRKGAAQCGKPCDVDAVCGAVGSHGCAGPFWAQKAPLRLNRAVEVGQHRRSDLEALQVAFRLMFKGSLSVEFVCGRCCHELPQESGKFTCKYSFLICQLCGSSTSRPTPPQTSPIFSA